MGTTEFRVLQQLRRGRQTHQVPVHPAVPQVPADEPRRLDVLLEHPHTPNDGKVPRNVSGCDLELRRLGSGKSRRNHQPTVFCHTSITVFHFSLFSLYLSLRPVSGTVLLCYVPGNCVSVKCVSFIVGIHVRAFVRPLGKTVFPHVWWWPSEPLRCLSVRAERVVDRRELLRQAAAGGNVPGLQYRQLPRVAHRRTDTGS